MLQMSVDILERYIAGRCAASAAPVIHFEWHGGEPTILGLDYFRKIIDLQRTYVPKDRSVSNGLQTNGILLDDAWADFLAREGFSVGLSLDGPDELHDCFRKTADNKPTQSLVVSAFHRLKTRGVFCNALCVLHAKNTAEPDAVYAFFRELGVQYIQFLPLTGSAKAVADPCAIGRFLCRVFDLWIRRDVGRMVIQNIDEALRPVYGIDHALCVHRQTCGDAAALEHNGNFYACDQFVDDEHLIGSLKTQSVKDLADAPAMIAFGDAKRNSLPGFCKSCDALEFCNGGCPKDRTAAAPDGETGLNCLCPAYKAFYHHVKPELIRLARHMKAGRPLRSFSAMQSTPFSSREKPPSGVNAASISP